MTTASPLATLAALGASRKAVFLFIVMAGLFAMAWTGRLPVADFVSFVKVTIPAWLAAVAWEDSQKKPDTAPPG